MNPPIMIVVSTSIVLIFAGLFSFIWEEDQKQEKIGQLEDVLRTYNYQCFN